MRALKTEKPCRKLFRWLFISELALGHLLLGVALIGWPGSASKALLESLGMIGPRLFGAISLMVAVMAYWSLAARNLKLWQIFCLASCALYVFMGFGILIRGGLNGAIAYGILALMSWRKSLARNPAWLIRLLEK